MRLTNMILTDFATAVAPVSTGSGEQTVRGSIVDVDPLNEKNVTVLLDGSRENTSATTTVEVEVNDRVMVLLKAHKAIVIGNISSPVLRTVTANKINAGAVNAQALTTDNITGTNGWINFHSGTFNYGNGALVWNGTKLTVDGTIETNDGTIGGWKISDGMISKSCSLTIDNTLYDYDTLMYAPTSPVGGNAAFGVRRKEHGSSDSAEYQFLVQYNGKLVAKNADITGAINTGSGKIGGWTINSDAIYKDTTINGVTYRAFMYAPENAVGGNAAFTVRYYDTASSSYKYPFCAHYDGTLSTTKLDATGGNVGGWTLSSAQIAKSIITGGYEYRPGLNAPSDAVPGSYAFFLAKRSNDGNGTTGAWSYPFWVKYNGDFHAENGYLSGEIQSSSGKIGGFTIGQETLSSEHIALASNDSTYGSLIRLWPSNNLLGVQLTPTAIVLNSAINSSNVITKYVDISNGGVTTSHDIYAGGTLTSQTIDNNVGTIVKTYRMEMVGSTASSGHGGYINFNYNKIVPSTTDWTNRIIAGNGIVYVRTGTTQNSGVSGVNGNLRFKTLAGNEDIPAIGSVTTAKEQVSHVRCSSATGFGVWGLWNTSSTWSWMYASMTTSDPKLKDNIKKSEMDALALVNKLPLYQFDWKADGKHWGVGFIAPELIDIDPALVHKPSESENDMWGVEGFYLQGVLTKAIQELSQKVDDLERRVA